MSCGAGEVCSSTGLHVWAIRPVTKQALAGPRLIHPWASHSLSLRPMVRPKHCASRSSSEQVRPGNFRTSATVDSQSPASAGTICAAAACEVVGSPARAKGENRGGG